MNDDTFVAEKKAYEVALQTRAFEIELFWKRSLFFWAFVAGAFAAFGSVYQHEAVLGLVVAGFGFVCSIAWTLANRGSKYWQQTWESRVASLEGQVTGPLFDIDTPVQKSGIAWFRARRFSVSKLTIALSDFISIVWALLAAGQLMRVLGFGATLRAYERVGAVGFIVFVCLYVFSIMTWCRTTKRSHHDHAL